MTNRTNEILSNMLEQNTKQAYIDRVPTLSGRERTSREILNSILSEHIEWYPTIAALVVYPIQSWAATVRQKIGIDISTLQKSISEQDEFFGIDTSHFLSSHAVALEQTEKELQLVSEILNKKNKNKYCYMTVRNVHGQERINVSKYLIDTHYRSEICQICEKYNKKFTAISQSIVKQIDVSDDEMRDVYHHTDILIRNLELLRDSSVRINGVDTDRTYDIIMQCIVALDDYYDSDKMMSEIIRMYSEGKPEYLIAKMTGKSRTYIRRRYKTGIEILSYLLWGYSTREILQTLNNS